MYSTGGSEEHFLSFNTPEDRLAGFLRLSLPGNAAPDHRLHDLENAAIVREVHVYGQSLEVGEDTPGVAQHSGLGTRLMLEAEHIAREARLQEPGRNCRTSGHAATTASSATRSVIRTC